LRLRHSAQQKHGMFLSPKRFYHNCRANKPYGAGLGACAVSAANRPRGHDDIDSDQGTAYRASPMSCFARIATLGVAVSAVLLCSSGYESARADPVGSAQKANGSTCDRSAFRVILDVGHTPKAFGATSARGHREYDFNLRLAKVIEQKLISGGFDKAMLLVTEGRSGRGLVAACGPCQQGVSRPVSVHSPRLGAGPLSREVGVRRTTAHFQRSVQRAFHFRLAPKQQFRSEPAVRQIAWPATQGARPAIHAPLRRKVHGSSPAPVAGCRSRRLSLRSADRAQGYAHPCSLLEAGSIINRDEELAMQTPERQGLIAAAVVDAVDNFCAARQPGSHERVAHQPGPSSGSRRVAAPASLGSSIIARPR